ncbi:alpha-L-fucosidase [Mucilaginibacter roseus]|uniref:alpha-L-fucosidase n=1 Tax=Mucilaginibacter roseus TaxID=1528868 RepID=A0ABS8U5Z0_9SPHI|nr:alpha-L-fucosidase [Mucilaginibacter roseus]MCD8742525.1 alpha-L-fucosidase [Mucilaginibacter roseus]
MRKLLRFILILLCFSPAAWAQQGYKPSESNLKAREHFKDMKFGLFIHWGIYSTLGDGEWVMDTRKIPYNDYKRLADFFNPQAFNAKEWVDLAKRAGMKYITVTSRHHDGFSMFDTKQSDYNIVKATPYKRDPMKELAEECQKQGIELRFYYSLLDWGRADYAFKSPIVNGVPEKGDWNSYINFMKAQLTELITNYPGVKGIWFDGHWDRKNANWHYDEIYGLIHKLGPDIMIGNNHHLAPIPGEDFQAFEKDLPGNNKTGFSGDAKIGDLPLETCETMNGSWGFNINDRNYKSVKELVHYLVNAAGLDANFLLNVGPMPNGKIQPEFVDTLGKIGAWIDKNGETIYGTRGYLVKAQAWGTVTAKGKTVYAHVLNPVKDGNQIVIPDFKFKPKSVTAFNGGAKLKYKKDKSGLIVYIDQLPADEIDRIVKITY